ncbi:hypothetical protein D3093_07830 [Azospirillum argentinense]|uniref:Uncharacterized protein n=1 Tax=Azospirillum argentinense TaxID=2970906 RepID=A0A4D8PFR4_9PROT|nr:hypothetical protein [Azospirillum argentinense]QCN95167.1 hypothetical protein D3093_07830 [Azospirillum argentinense]
MSLLVRCPSLLQIALSAILLLTALLELFDTMLEDLIGVEITTAHGLLVFAVGKILKEWIEVRRQFSETREKLGEARVTEAAPSSLG